MEHMLQTLNPVKSVRYLERHFQLLDSVIIRHKPTKTYLRLIMLSLFISGLQQLMLYLWPPNTYFKQIVYFDYLRMLGFAQELKLMAFGKTMLIVYYYHLFYFGKHSDGCGLVRKVACYQNDSFFIRKDFNRKKIVDIIRFDCKRLFIALSCWIVIVDLYIAYHEIENVFFLYHYKHILFSTWKGFSNLIISQLCITNSLLAVGFISHILCIIFSVATIFTRIGYIHIKQMGNLIQWQHCHSPLAMVRLRLFTRLSTRILLHVLYNNPIYGQILASFIVVNCPINAYLMMSMFMGKIVGLQLYLAIPFVCYQLIIILLLHYLATKFTHHLHATSPNVLHIYIHNWHKSQTIRFRMKIANYIDAFHTKNRYGLTYGKIGGLVTLNGLIKVGGGGSLLYSLYSNQNSIYS